MSSRATYLFSGSDRNRSSSVKHLAIHERIRSTGANPAPGRLRDPPLGYYGPCARCSLTAPVHLGDTQARPGAELLARKASGESRRWSAARRARSQRALRLTSAAIGAPCGAPLPSRLVRGMKGQTQPVRHDKRVAERWLSPRIPGPPKAGARNP